MVEEKVNIGVIGGSGLYQMDELQDIVTKNIHTPFGDPSDEIIIGTLNNKRVAFLPRHKRGHCIMPTELNFRANIYALKSIGVEWIISISAVGSLKEELKPLDIVLPDQLIDNTKYRVSTFFGKGMVAHIGFADPFCNVLRKIIYNVAKDMDCSIHMDGTYICIEGPQFSTRAESNMYRAIGCDVIGMTAVPEAKLAREAQMCYATVAMVTDYDVWYEASEDVTVDMVIENLNKNVTTARKIIQGVVKHIPEQRKECGCSTALKDAVITNHEAIPKDVKERLKILFD